MSGERGDAAEPWGVATPAVEETFATSMEAALEGAGSRLSREPRRCVGVAERLGKVAPPPDRQLARPTVGAFRAMLRQAVQSGNATGIAAVHVVMWQERARSFKEIRSSESSDVVAHSREAGCLEFVAAVCTLVDRRADRGEATTAV